MIRRILHALRVSIDDLDKMTYLCSHSCFQGYGSSQDWYHKGTLLLTKEHYDQLTLKELQAEVKEVIEDA